VNFVKLIPLTRAFILFAVATLLALVTFAETVTAQGFIVKPMRLETALRPGQSANALLEITNTREFSSIIDLRVVELSQNSHGGWIIVEDGEGSNHSASNWITLDSASLDIAPLDAVLAPVRIEVPHGARGYHFAGVVAETRPDPDALGIRLSVRFLIPLIIEIEGRPVRQNVRLDDVSMHFDDGQRGVEEEVRAPTTFAAAVIANEGGTFSQVGGEVRIDRKSGERWRLVTKYDFPERGIIPGVSLDLRRDLGRRLPSGTYRLRGQIYVDGRRITPIDKEIEFEGDPNIDSLAYDTSLTLEPEMVRMEIAAGATRATAVSIENPGDDPIRVRMSAITPESLQAKAMGKLRGEELSAAQWTEIRPAEFTLRARGRQNVRVITRVPREELEQGNYYADLVLESEYEDGQSAGTTRSTAHLVNDAVAADPNGIVERLSISQADEPFVYFAQLRFINIGNVHVEPTGHLELLTPRRATVLDRVLTSDGGALLPLGTRDFGGPLDLSGLDPGHYLLRGSIRFGDGRQVVEQRVLELKVEQVVNEDGESVAVPEVTVIDSEELPEGLDVSPDGVGGESPTDGLEDRAGHLFRELSDRKSQWACLVSC
jgi:hypothetical protein